MSNGWLCTCGLRPYSTDEAQALRLTTVTPTPARALILEQPAAQPAPIMRMQTPPATHNPAVRPRHIPIVPLVPREAAAVAPALERPRTNWGGLNLHKNTARPDSETLGADVIGALSRIIVPPRSFNDAQLQELQADSPTSVYNNRF